MPGVKTYVGADDVAGHNATGPVLFDEEIFASEKVETKTHKKLLQLKTTPGKLGKGDSHMKMMGLLIIPFWNQNWSISTA